MNRIAIACVFAVATLSGCAPAPLATGSGAAPAIEATPGKGVIYIVRPRPDVSYLAAPILLNNDMIGASYAGTYFRLEVPPGRHRIQGYAHDNGAITLNVEADRVYFVQHTVSGSWRATSPHSFFQLIDESRARSAMIGAERG